MRYTVPGRQSCASASKHEPDMCKTSVSPEARGRDVPVSAEPMRVSATENQQVEIQHDAFIEQDIEQVVTVTRGSRTIERANPRARTSRQGLIRHGSPCACAARDFPGSVRVAAVLPSVGAPGSGRGASAGAVPATPGQNASSNSRASLSLPQLGQLSRGTSARCQPGALASVQLGNSNPYLAAVSNEASAARMPSSSTPATDTIMSALRTMPLSSSVSMTWVRLARDRVAAAGAPAVMCGRPLTLSADTCIPDKPLNPSMVLNTCTMIGFAWLA